MTNIYFSIIAGPTNVSISGPSLMNPTVSHTYNCYAYCQPSCYYSWRTDKGPWIRSQGNVVSITPREMDTSKTVTCKATNRISGLFATATQNIAVTCKSRFGDKCKTGSKYLYTKIILLIKEGYGHNYFLSSSNFFF